MLKTICTNSICGNCLVKTFDFVLMSKIKPPFQKIVFTRDIAKVSGENKSNVCSSLLLWQNAILQ
jgi:hypothetical protein